MKSSIKTKAKRFIFATFMPLLLLVGYTYAKPLKELSWSDNNLEKCVNDLAKKKNWTNTEQFTHLKCHNDKIVNADELRYFTSLKNLSLYNNKLTALDLRDLKNLVTLNLANNKLIELNIAGLNQVETLFLFRNKLTTLDLTGLAAVKKVRLMQNKLVALDITPLKALENGYFFDNKLEDLQITGLTKLKFLDVKQNPMPDELYDFYDEQKGMVISHDGNADDWK